MSSALSTTLTPNIDELSINGVVIDAAAIAAETSLHADEANPDHAARRAWVVR